MQKATFENSAGLSIAFGGEPPFFFGGLKGQSEQSTSLVTVKTIGLDGETYSSLTVGTGQLKLRVITRADTPDNLLRLRRKLVQLFNPLLGPGKLTYQRSDTAEARWIMCIADGIPDMLYEGAALVREDTFVLKSLDPFWRKNTVISGFSTMSGGIYFPFGILEEGRDFGYRLVNVIKDFENPGDKPCGAKITLTAFGPVVNPSFECLETGEKFQIQYTMAAEEVVEVVTEYNKHQITSIKNGVSSNIIDSYVVSSTFLKIATGNNTYRYDAQSGVDNLSVSIAFTPLYLGE